MTITPATYPLHGVDVSTYQLPSQVPQAVDFVIVRASYGSKPDKRTVTHFEALRQRQRCEVGLYHFFVPGHASQLKILREQADAVKLAPGDLIPWIDIEDASGKGAEPPRPSWCAELHDLLQACTEAWGRVGCYITQRDWKLLGSPPWLLEHPIWVAHWRTSPGPPATPNDVEPALWQHRVGPWKRGALHELGGHNARNAIDHDCAAQLPLIAEPDAPVAEAVLRPELIPLELDWEAMRAERDDEVEEL